MTQTPTTDSGVHLHRHYIDAQLLCDNWWTRLQTLARIIWALPDTVVICCDNLTFTCRLRIWHRRPKIVSRFYTVQYEHMKQDVLGCASVFVPNFLEYVSAKKWQNGMKSEKYITGIKRVKFFWDCILCWDHITVVYLLIMTHHNSHNVILKRETLAI